MRCLYPIALILVISLFGLEAKAGLEGDAVIVSERFRTVDEIQNPVAVLVETGDADAVTMPGQNATTINVDPDAITLTFGCDFNICNRTTTSAEFNGFAVADLDWTDSPGPAIGFEIESSLFFDPKRVQLGSDEILIDAIFSVWQDQDFVRIQFLFPPPVSIDIDPKRPRNLITNRGSISVAVLGSAEIDVSKLNPFSLRFGPGEAIGAKSTRKQDKYNLVVRDVNRDDFDDLTLSFKAKEAAIPTDATEACLSGTFDGTAFVACDAVESKGGNR
jgi:hypothetical protein